MCFKLQRNIAARQIEEKCCPYYRTFSVYNNTKSSPNVYRGVNHFITQTLLQWLYENTFGYISPYAACSQRLSDNLNSYTFSSSWVANP